MKILSINNFNSNYNQNFKAKLNPTTLQRVSKCITKTPEGKIALSEALEKLEQIGEKDTVLRFGNFVKTYNANEIEGTAYSDFVNHTYHSYKKSIPVHVSNSKFSEKETSFVVDFENGFTEFADGVGYDAKKHHFPIANLFDALRNIIHSAEKIKTCEEILAKRKA